MSIDIDQREFDIGGGLTSFGKSIFWCEVDQAIQKFDLDKIKLRPRKYKSQLESKAQKIQLQPEQRKLPTPPPRKCIVTDHGRSITRSHE